MIYQLKVALLNVKKPPVWRRVLVPSTSTFDQLHLVIQSAMGWGNYHLYQFGYNAYDASLTITVPSEDDWVRPKNSMKTKIEQYLNPAHPKMKYTYDFGDDWIHDVILEKVFSDDEVLQPLPFCVEAKGACPPEDCGGPWGYEELKKLASKKDLDDEEMERLEWFGIYPDDFDPKMVDIEEINRDLQRLNLGWSRKKKIDDKKLEERIAIIEDMTKGWCREFLDKKDAESILEACGELVEAITASQYNITLGRAEIWAAAIVIVAMEDILCEELESYGLSRQKVCDAFGVKQAGVNGRLTNIHDVLFVHGIEEPEEQYPDEILSRLAELEKAYGLAPGQLLEALMNGCKK